MIDEMIVERHPRLSGLGLAPSELLSRVGAFGNGNNFNGVVAEVRCADRDG